MPKTSAKKKTTATKKKTVKPAAPKKVVKESFEDADNLTKETKKAAEPKATKAQKVPKAETRSYFYGYGKRKTSGASVRLLVNGNGTITVNNRTFENYFPVSTDQDKILAPLRITNTVKTFDITVMARGGGIHSQAEAVRHGIAKALLACDVAYRAALKSAGFITRDSRIKERKKYGLKRARRAPQWQKR